MKKDVKGGGRVGWLIGCMGEVCVSQSVMGGGQVVVIHGGGYIFPHTCFDGDDGCVSMHGCIGR